eukprot:1265933-Rhodomonas_salina.3
MSRLCYFPARPCLVILAALALCVEGALDSVKGPREHPDADGITSVQRQLWEAALEGDTKLLNITNLITAGADPNGHNHDHMTALHWAVIKGQRLAVELLIDRGAHTDVRDSSYRTPAHFCAVYGWGEAFPSVLTSLYYAGANLNAGDQSHNTPLHLAAFEGHTSTVREFIRLGAKLNMANLWSQRTPLGMAVAAGNTETADALREAGAVDEVISRLPACADPPHCTAPCTDDQSNWAFGPGAWGCYQNNFFMGDQPVSEPVPPEPTQQLGVIQGTVVS